MADPDQAISRKSSSQEQGLSDGNQPCGFFGGSLSSSSGHKSSINSRMDRRRPRWHFLVDALDLVGHNDPTVENAGLIDAALFGHSRRQLFANAIPLPGLRAGGNFPAQAAKTA
jgi:hypothetical protein